jgi:UDP-N-acetylenolpyruvoylglucosamine reductase
MMPIRFVSVVVLALGLLVGVAAQAHAVGMPGSVGGPAKQNAGVVIGKPIQKHH